VRLVVIGGGVTGLAAAHRAVELARERSLELDLTVLEGRDRLGGTIATERTDGFLVEAGPDSFLSEKPWALALCRRLGVEDRLVRTDDRFRKVFVWHGGRLHPLPDGFQLLAPTRFGPFLASGLFSWPGKLRMGLDLVLPRGTGDDESLGAFVRRRLGREALERVAQPLVAGIYTADPDDLSLAATMPRFLELERRERSLILGLWRATRKAPMPGTSGARWSLFVTFADGMQALIDVLASRLPPGRVALKQRATGLERDGGRWRVATAGGERLVADRVIVSAEAHATARLVRYLDPTLAALLDGIPYSSAATVSLGYRRADVPHALDGFGFVVPRTEGRSLLAVQREVPGARTRGPRAPAVLPGRDAGRARARGGRRLAGGAGARRTARGAGDRGGAGADAPLAVAGLDAAVPGGTPGARGHDRPPGRGPARARARRRCLPGRRHRRLRPVRGVRRRARPGLSRRLPAAPAAEGERGQQARPGEGDADGLHRGDAVLVVGVGVAVGAAGPGRQGNQDQHHRQCAERHQLLHVRSPFAAGATPHCRGNRRARGRSSGFARLRRPETHANRPG
jgi:oxygen-dependent protoporphyrinogen oxidase